MKKKITFLILIMLISIAAICLGACAEKGYKISYLTDGNGTIQGEAVQKLKPDEESSTVTAVPNEGYKFVKWSDNNTEAARTDKIKDSDLAFTAIFEKCKYTVSYSATDGCYIDGEFIQTVEYGESTSEVTAVPLYGYRFIKWSDTDSTNPVRRDVVKSDITATAIVEVIRTDIQFLTYQTDGNGTIDGQVYQQVVYDKNASVVTAIPNDGYEFLQWSDGVKTAERQDLNVTESKTLTAQFKRIYVRYNLDYKLGKAKTNITELIFYDNYFETVSFPVPTRELFTFGGWYIGDTQVTNTYGKMIIGKELLSKEGKEIYAKWTANENYTYKILMVYVTELDASIPKRDGSGKVDVYYKMSDFDIEICKTITVQMRTYLNDLMDGLVTFEIDEYFTTTPVGTDSISTGRTVNGESSNIFANNIPELIELGLLKQYQSSLVVFCMNDFDHEFRDSAGVAYIKYGTVYLESVYDENLINNEPIEVILDVNYWRWNKIIEPFLHELAHTIELQIDDKHDYYHDTLSWCTNHGIYDNIIPNKLYYLNQIEIDGVKVGIPIEFWKGEMKLITRD